MRTRTIYLLALSVIMSGCTIGQNPEEWGVSRAAAGANATVVTASATIKGELIEVSKNGVVMLRSDRTLAFAPFTAIRGLEVPGLGTDYLVNGQSPMTADKKARFALLSHFPQGMPPAARDQLLAASGQKEVTVIE